MCALCVFAYVSDLGWEDGWEVVGRTRLREMLGFVTEVLCLGIC